jgi:hypothetical protein
MSGFLRVEDDSELGVSPMRSAAGMLCYVVKLP